MSMDRELDLADIQGNILEQFVKTFPVARFVLLRVGDAEKGRAFVQDYRSKVTTALRWSSGDAFVQKVQATKPAVAINIGFSYAGFVALGLPTRTLARLPHEFIDGMKKRAAILGDDLNARDLGPGGEQPSRTELPAAPGADSKNPNAAPGSDDPPAVQRWDDVWRGEQAHIIIGLNCELGPDREPVPALKTATDELEALCTKYGLEVLTGHGRNHARYQDARVQMTKKEERYELVPKEHFGFIDGISNPVFDGQYGHPLADLEMSIGNGKLGKADPKAPSNSRWSPLATGEVQLG